jgi:hypothetical protein
MPLLHKKNTYRVVCSTSHATIYYRLCFTKLRVSFALRDFFQLSVRHLYSRVLPGYTSTIRTTRQSATTHAYLHKIVEKTKFSAGGKYLIWETCRKDNKHIQKRLNCVDIMAEYAKSSNKNKSFLLIATGGKTKFE